MNSRFWLSCLGHPVTFSIWSPARLGIEFHGSLYLPQACSHITRPPGGMRRFTEGTKMTPQELQKHVEECFSSPVANVTEILAQKGWDANKMEALQHSNIKVTLDSVLNVLRLKTRPDVVLRFFDWAGQQKGYTHSFRAYHAMMVFLGRKKKFKDLDRLLEDMEREGLKMNEIVLSTLIRLYGRAGKLKKAFETFCEMENRGLIRSAMGCTNMLWVLLKAERYKTMLLVYKRMLAVGHPLDIDSFNILIEGLCKRGRIDEARNILDFMKGHGSVPNSRSSKLLICSLCKARRLETAYQLLSTMLKEGCVSDAVAYTEIIKGFCRRRNMHVAYEIFDSMVKSGCGPSVVTFNVLISGALTASEVDRAVNYLDEMKNMGCSPDSLTYTTLINGLCRARKLEKACKVLYRMEIDYCNAVSQPYKLVIISLLKAGKVKTAYELVCSTMNKGYILDRVVYTEVVDHLFLTGNMHEAKGLLERVTGSIFTESNEENL